MKSIRSVYAVALVVLVGALGAIPSIVRPGLAATGPNLIANPSCLTSTAGWSGFRASLSTSAIGACEVKAAVGATGYQIDNFPGISVRNSAGTQYGASASVAAASRSATGKPVQLVLVEKSPTGAMIQKSLSTPADLTTSFATLKVSLNLKSSGDSLAIRVTQSNATSGNIFFAREMSLAGPAVTTPVPTAAPTPVPTPTVTPVATATPAPTPVPTAAPSPTPVPSANVAQFWRISYTNSTGATDESTYHYRVLDLQDPSATLVSALHSSSQSVKVLNYMGIMMKPTDTGGINTCAAWKPTTQYPYGGIPTSDYLLDSAGKPLYSSNYGGLYLLDPSLAAVQQLCTNHALTMAKANGADGSYNDSLNAHFQWNGVPFCTGGSAACQSDANWNAALTSFLQYYGSVLHANGKIAIGNIGGAYGGATYQQYWSKWSSLIDGALEESFGFGTNKLPVSQAQVNQELQNVAWSEANHKLALLNADLPANNLSDSTYGLAMMLLVANGYSAWDVSEGTYGGSYEYWPSVYNTARSLGAPLGGYTVNGSVYTRHFANGTVTVDVSNTTASIT